MLRDRLPSGAVCGADTVTIIVCPLHDVDAIVQLRRPTHIIRLLSPKAEQTLCASPDAQVLDLRFHDIAEPRDTLAAPEEKHIRDLLGFAKPAGDGPLLVHCWAGVSRSTAAAFIIACQRSAPGNEDNIAQELRNRAPYATPNPLIISLADAMLDRGGRMIDAAARIGRGQDTAWGSVFTLP